VDGQVELGVIGCPNLGSSPAKLGEEIIPNGEGVLMIAVKGEGSYSVCLSYSVYFDVPCTGQRLARERSGVGVYRIKLPSPTLELSTWSLTRLSYSPLQCICQAFRESAKMDSAPCQHPPTPASTSPPLPPPRLSLSSNPSRRATRPMASRPRLASSWKSSARPYGWTVRPSMRVWRAARGVSSTSIYLSFISFSLPLLLYL
jgi:hypothetical protein